MTLATPALGEPIKQIVVPGTQALAWSEAGHLAQAAEAAQAAERRRGGWDSASTSSPWITCVRWPVWRWSGASSTPPSSSPSRRCRYRSAGGPAFEFLALLDRAAIWAARGQVRSALAAVEAARPILAGTGSELLARADELEALLRLSLGDPRTPAELASRLPACPPRPCCWPGSRWPLAITAPRRYTCRRVAGWADAAARAGAPGTAGRRRH